MAITGPTRDATNSTLNISLYEWAYGATSDTGTTTALILSDLKGDMICEVNSSGTTDTFTLQGSVTGDVYVTVKDLDGNDCSGTGDQVYAVRSQYRRFRINKASGTTDSATITFQVNEMRA